MGNVTDAGAEVPSMIGELSIHDLFADDHYLYRVTDDSDPENARVQRIAFRAGNSLRWNETPAEEENYRADVKLTLKDGLFRIDKTE